MEDLEEQFGIDDLPLVGDLIAGWWGEEADKAKLKPAEKQVAFSHPLATAQLSFFKVHEKALSLPVRKTLMWTAHGPMLFCMHTGTL